MKIKILLDQRFLAECFLINAIERLENATSDKQITFLKQHIAGLQYQIQSLLN